MSCKRILTALALSALFATSCSRTARPPVEQVAILPFENLSADQSLDWLAPAIPAAVAEELALAPGIHAFAAPSVREAQSAQAGRILQGYFTFRNGVLRVQAVLRDETTRRTVGSSEFVAPAVSGGLPVLGPIARLCSPAARTFSTGNPEAFRLFGQALAAGQPVGLGRAIALDPSFAAAYISLANVLAARNDRAELSALAERSAGLPAFDRARVQAAAAVRAADRVPALSVLVREKPGDPFLLRSLGEAQYEARAFPEAIQNLRSAADAGSSDPSVWNLLGYSQAWTGDLNAARQSLEKYRSLVPASDPNPFDSLGEVSFSLRDFKTAEFNFTQAAQRNGAGDWLKAAEARLMTGDLPGADALFAKHLETVRSEPALAVILGAEWRFLTGRRRAAMAALEAEASNLPPSLAAYVHTQLLLWKVQTGALPSSAAPVTPPVSLLFAGRFKEAIPMLRELLERINPARDGDIRTLLSWALFETGDTAGAYRLIANIPLPFGSGEQVLVSLSFPRVLYLESKAMESDGRHDAARRDLELYTKLIGDLPDAFLPGDSHP